MGHHSGEGIPSRHQPAVLSYTDAQPIYLRLLAVFSRERTSTALSDLGSWVRWEDRALDTAHQPNRVDRSHS